MKRKEILPFATTRMDLEGVTVSEISQTRTTAAWYHLHMESENARPTETVHWWLPGTRWGRRGDVGQKAQTTSYQMNTFWGSNVWRDDYS